MLTATEIPAERAPGHPKMPPRAADAAPECDLCGRPVRRESAFQRVHRGHDGVEVVLVCRECECGAD